jgi:hypothetical protein
MKDLTPFFLRGLHNGKPGPIYFLKLLKIMAIAVLYYFSQGTNWHDTHENKKQK